MSDSNERAEPRCPVCREHSEADNLAAQQVMLRGIQAIFEGDDDMIRDVYSCLEPYDGHTAISFAASLLADLSEMTQIPLEHMLLAYRRRLDEAQQEQARNS